MSRAFVKEEDIEAIEELPDKPVSPHTNYVTPRGLKQLQQRLADNLARRSELTSRDELAARQALPAVRREIRYLEQRVESAVLVEPSGQTENRVHFGAAVDVLDQDDELQTYRIVGEDEADVVKGDISWVSPLAKALLNAGVGEVVTWRRPAGDVELEIAAIRRGEP
ncbi:GreA/GreB family elongation factor [Methylococcus sp. EFPC2]|uniref:GreA/GreB family elongation factor n=1 Tax=Methylococcus sp. EFPC2 TaxID=2812648 RepID=UPI0019689628|nr:GreA/GreB family elongation factor [Methylococcus sp. EFPC2]QSA97160.1 GreA/GreB family elongation factor [Methylococcus sp. EFPC2]